MRSWLMVACLLVLVLGFALVLMPEEDSFTVASWNLQVFGDKKASDPVLLVRYADVIDDYDVVVVQEIRDADGSAWDSLCALLANHSCVISGRTGRSSSKEQYGLMVRDGFNITSTHDFSSDMQDLFERPPFRVSLRRDNYEFHVFTIHVRPDSAHEELLALEGLLGDVESGNVLLIGDLNADCGYYDVSERGFDRWRWVIGDDEDTTVGWSDCAYDRILSNTDASEDILGGGVRTEGIDESLSDHYLVWARIRSGASTK